MTLAEVKLWGRTIGAVSWDESIGLAAFEYAPSFLNSGIEVAPMTMPLSDRIYSFPALPRETFYGLPGAPCRFPAGRFRKRPDRRMARETRV